MRSVTILLFSLFVLTNCEDLTFYHTLNVTNVNTATEIKKAFRRMAMEWHPDKHKGKETHQAAIDTMKKINEAYDVLSDQEKRESYDKLLMRMQSHGQWKSTFNEYTGNTAHGPSWVDNLMLCPAWVEYYYGLLAAVLVCGGGGLGLPLFVTFVLGLVLSFMRWGYTQPSGFMSLPWNFMKTLLVVTQGVIMFCVLVLSISYLEMLLIAGFMFVVPTALLYLGFVFSTSASTQLKVLRPFFAMSRAIKRVYNTVNTRPFEKTMKDDKGRSFKVLLNAKQVETSRIEQEEQEQERQEQVRKQQVETARLRQKEQELQQQKQTVATSIKVQEKKKKEWHEMDEDEKVDSLLKDVEMSSKKGARAAKTTQEVLQQLFEGWGKTKGGKRTLANNGAIQTLGVAIERNFTSPRIVALGVHLLNAIADIESTHGDMEEYEAPRSVKLGVGSSTDPDVIMAACNFMMKLPPRLLRKYGISEIRRASTKIPAEHPDAAECVKLVGALAKSVPP